MDIQSTAVNDVVNQLCPPPQIMERRNCCFMCMRIIEKEEKSDSLPVTERLNKSFDSILYYLTGNSHRHLNHHDSVNGKLGLETNNWRNGKGKSGDDSSDHSSNQNEDGSDYVSKLKQVPPFCIGCYDILGNIYDLHQSLVKTQREIEQQAFIARSIVKRSFHTQDYHKGGRGEANLVYKLREEITRNAKNQVLFPSQLPPPEEEGSSTGTVPSPMSPLPLLVNLVENDSRDNGHISAENEHRMYRHHQPNLQSPSTSSAAAAAAMSNVPVILRMPDGQALAMIPSSMISSQQGQQAVVVEMEDEKISNVQVVGDFAQQQGICQRINGKQVLMMMKPPGIPCTSEGTPFIDPRSGQVAYLQFPQSSNSPGFQHAYFPPGQNDDMGNAAAVGNVHMAHHSVGSAPHDSSSVQPMILNMSPPYTRHVPPSLESLLNKLGIPPPISENQSLDASINPNTGELQRSSEGISTPTPSDTVDDLMPPPGPASTCSSSEWSTTHHPCDVCSAEIPKQSIYPHLISHVGAEYVFHCEYCQVSFLTPFRLKAYHEGKMKTDDKCPGYDPETYLINYLKCEQCSFKADSIFMLKTHLSSHENEKTPEEKIVKCPMCTVKFSLKGSALLHLQDCHIYNKSKRRSEICEQCKKSLSLHEMETHLRNTHSIHPIRLLRCKFCPAVFTSLKAIIEHQKQAGQHNVHPISCHLCDHKFDLATYLRDHYYKEHNLRERYRCQHCLKDFHALKIYESHKTMCTVGSGGNAKKRNSPSKSKFKKKRASPSTSSALKCSDCGKRFLREHLFKKHIASAHQPGARGGMKQSKRYTFVCEKCGEAFEMQALLNYHARMEHSKDERTPPRSMESIRKMENAVEAPVELNNVSNSEKSEGSSVEVVQENSTVVVECGDGEDIGNESDSRLGATTPIPVETEEESTESNGSTIVQTNDNNNAERPYKCRLCGQGFNHLSNRFTHERSHKMLGKKFKPAGPRQ